MALIVRELMEALVLALIVLFVIQISVQNYRVDGHSMEPTLEDAQFLMVNKLSYLRMDLDRLDNLVPFWDSPSGTASYTPFAGSPERGDVIVFQRAGGSDMSFVKRVIGLPGERVEIREGHVFIDGEELEEPYLDRSDRVGDMLCIPHTSNCRVGEDEYFVLGDNRTDSQDSRSWGSIREDDIAGEVWFTYWPLCDAPHMDTLFDACE
ncbi:MAG: signal peptidase I [Dehalococcoidia bacterium]|nr:signal peptidase I [Dehalococcoidia bacterium]